VGEYDQEEKDGSTLDHENQTQNKRQWPWWVMLPFLLVWTGLMFFWAYRTVEEWRARSAILELLDAPDDQIAVTVNGQPISNGIEVIPAIRGLHSAAAHHSHPDHKIALVIRKNQKVLELTLRRDSDFAQEYWVFWTREVDDPNRLEIGRIQTSAFDKQ
jgi:hypothetical protein